MDDISVLYTSDLTDLLATIRYMAILDFLRISRVNLYNLYKIIDDCCTLTVNWIDIKGTRTNPLKISPLSKLFSIV